MSTRSHSPGYFWMMAARPDVIGETGGVVADAGQYRRIQSGQPLQAEEIQAGHGGDAVDMKRLAARIQHGNIDPAEVEAITGGPDYRANTGGAEIKPPQRLGETMRVRPHRAGGGVGRHFEAMGFGVGIH